jgi:hypothetical protein
MQARCACMEYKYSLPFSCDVLLDVFYAIDSDNKLLSLKITISFSCVILLFSFWFSHISRRLCIFLFVFLFLHSNLF